MAQNKTIYSGYSGLITKLIKALQLYNIIVEKVKKKETLNKYIAKAGEQYFNKYSLLKYS